MLLRVLSGIAGCQMNLQNYIMHVTDSALAAFGIRDERVGFVFNARISRLLRTGTILSTIMTVLSELIRTSYLGWAP